MLGCGFIGEFHALGLRYVRDARLVASCDANPERGAAYAARFGGTAYATVEELCADPEVDLVIVSLPNHLHRDAVRVADCARTRELALRGGAWGEAGGGLELRLGVVAAELTGRAGCKLLDLREVHRYYLVLLLSLRTLKL
jgi:hypothetical protein